MIIVKKGFITRSEALGIKKCLRSSAVPTESGMKKAEIYIVKVNVQKRVGGKDDFSALNKADRFYGNRSSR
jgi:hypothetical protein